MSTTPDSQCRIGDTVRIQETRPISRTKHWRLLEIMARREVADVRAIDLEGDAVIEPTAEESDYIAPDLAGSYDFNNTNDGEDAQ